MNNYSLLFFKKGGDFLLTDPAVEKEILPSKLRLKYWRRPAGQKAPLGPQADFPWHWNYYMDVLHIDLKIKSEHTLCGKQYPAELQYQFVEGTLRKEAITIAVMVDFHPEDEINWHFQHAINAWWKVFVDDLTLCLDNQRRVLHSDLKSKNGMYQHFQNIANISSLRENENELDAIFSSEDPDHYFRETFKNTADEDKVFQQLNDYSVKFRKEIVSKNDIQVNQKGKKLRGQRDLNDVYYSPDLKEGDDPTSPGYWNPFSHHIFRTFWFYGYIGSLTEPPCTPGIHWRVMDKPMLISKLQYRMLQRVLFNHVDRHCRLPSSHYQGSVARPLQNQSPDRIWQCTRDNFESDKVKLQQKGNQ